MLNNSLPVAPDTSIKTDRFPLLITGANARVGFALTHELWLAGYPIIATYREDPGNLAQLVGVDALQVDLTVPAQRDHLIATILAKYSGLRGIIHNASLWLPDSAENMAKMQAVHVDAPYLLNLALADLLQAGAAADTVRRMTDIIHISDESSMRGSRNHIGYAATKAASANLALSFAKTLAPAVKVNTVAPGFLLTPAGSPDEYKAQAMAKGLIQSEPGAAPLIEAVRFLLENRYATGTTVVVNGGRHLK